MRFKLDENFGVRTQHLFREAGHEAQTVRDQGFQGCADERLFAICAGEQLCLVTLDLDFADVTRFAPASSAGVVVIRPPRDPSLSLLEGLVRQFLEALQRQPFKAELWIVEAGRIRIHQSD